MATIAGDEWTGPEAESEAQDLREVRRRRAELLESITTLEQALAAPGRQVRWAERVSVALLELSGDFRDHVELTEGASGLYSRVIRSSPRLAHAVDRLTQEHITLTGLIEDLISRIGQPDELSTTSEPVPGDNDEVRERGTSLLGDLVRHRQRGSDLVWEAFSVDIGGQD